MADSDIELRARVDALTERMNVVERRLGIGGVRVAPEWSALEMPRVVAPAMARLRLLRRLLRRRWWMRRRRVRREGRRRRWRVWRRREVTHSTQRRRFLILFRQLRARREAAPHEQAP